MRAWITAMTAGLGTVPVSFAAAAAPLGGEASQHQADLAIRPGEATARQTTTVRDLQPSQPGSERFSIYDNALLALLRMSTNQREGAARILAALAQLQTDDGGIAFSGSFANPAATAAYVRSGALAWVGYAAARYLNDAADGPERPVITAMVHKIAGYLLQHQITDPRDPRAGLVLGGFGTYTNVLRSGGEVVEEFVPSPIAWASTEHNIDAYFFFRTLSQLTGDARYTTAATTIADALTDKLWNAQSGQFAQGLSDHGRDETLALDCASWGALFLIANGDRTRAAQALATAEQRYGVNLHGLQGHRPYVAGLIVEPPELAAQLHLPPTGNDWGQLQAIWPEGSAGVALAAWRLGDHARAQNLLQQLDQLRSPGGYLPDLTEPVPFVFSGGPSLAGTLWAALVRAEPKGGIW